MGGGRVAGKKIKPKFPIFFAPLFNIKTKNHFVLFFSHPPRPPYPPPPPPPQEIFLVLISVRGWVNPSGHSAAGKDYVNEKFQPATFRLVAQCLNQLRHRVPLLYIGRRIYLLFIYRSCYCVSICRVFHIKCANLEILECCNDVTVDNRSYLDIEFFP
jgi:hypothetical protein